MTKRASGVLWVVVFGLFWLVSLRWGQWWHDATPWWLGFPTWLWGFVGVQLLLAVAFWLFATTWWTDATEAEQANDD